EKAPVIAPAHQLLARLPAPQQASVKQLADRDFAGFSALVFNDQVKLVACRYGAIDIDLVAERAKILLDRAARCASGTSGPVDAVTHNAANTQWSVVHLDRPGVQRKPPIAPFNRELQIEARPQRQSIDGPRRT